MPYPLLMGLLLMMVPAAAAGQEAPGSIAGTVGFPAEEVPALRIYAIAVKGGTHYAVATKRKQARFLLKGIPAGQYYVVGYPATKGESPAEAGGWTRFVQCGMSVQCKDHSLVPITVAAGKTTAGINVADWYAPPGSLPPEPVRVALAPGAGDCAAKGSQIEEDACNLDALKAADAVLNREYQRLLVDLAKAPRCRDRLRDAQRAWIRFRDEQCRYEGAIGAKGSTTLCLREITTRRAEYLTQQTPDLCNP